MAPQLLTVGASSAGTCPHVHIQALTNTPEHTQAAAFSCPAHHGLLRGSWCHRSQPGPPQTASQGCSVAMCSPDLQSCIAESGGLEGQDKAGAGAARSWCKCAQMLRLSWERSLKKNPLHWESQESLKLMAGKFRTNKIKPQFAGATWGHGAATQQVTEPQEGRFYDQP